MSREKKVEIIKRAIKEFFYMFPDCLQDGDLEQFIITKHKSVYWVELWSDGKSYIHLVTE